ncbi:MAG TPA: hypothetical protein VGN82_00445 [Bosea sp. (in: a-proteobacteria)]|jgi:hypothetical protein|uniref:hypothetical protein n=1 Tax=Bosea sp. (in: a-proteobacteria) TaxID=1871050 RepID=UPI002E120D02|nr:hypothetical protein [Bosea sp. (in: a-proteobacteria)]
MTAVGFTETIWHFAGYLHIADALARSTEIYDGERGPRQPDDFYASLRGSGVRPEFEETASRPVLLPEPSFTDVSHHLSRAPTPAAAAPHPGVASTQVPFTKLPLQHEAELTVHGKLVIQLHLSPKIAVEYADGGYDTMVAIKQINQMEDRDTLTADTLVLQGEHAEDGTIIVPEAVDTSPIVENMIARALAETPDSMPRIAAGDGASMIAAIHDRDAGWRAEGHSPEADATVVPPVGRIVDGVATDAPLPVIDPYDTVPWRTAPAQPVIAAESRIDSAAPVGGVGTQAETGQNIQVNAAVIIDANEMSGSLIVGGDYFFSRGIVQVNILTDSDHVDIARPDDALPDVRTSGNEVHNVAEFVTHDIIVVHQGAAGTPRWQIDVFKGDFYDVKAIVQFNGLDDNDRTVQTTENTLFDAKTGGNEQTNLAQVYGFDHYDIIMIRGDFHRVDWIFQYNIVLDSDAAKLLSGGHDDGDGAQVSTGFNSLVNEASITTYDSAGFKPLNEAQRSLLDGFDQKVTALTPNADWMLTGSITGTLKVLYVDGNYYDINTITQINVLSDVDQSMAASTTDNSIQGVSAGGNSARNEAHIVDPGTLSTSKYVGGDLYEESILVQTNIITENDKVVVHDTSTLVTEFVAFADEHGHAESCQPDARPTEPTVSSDHIMSQLLS